MPRVFGRAELQLKPLAGSAAAPCGSAEAAEAAREGAALERVVPKPAGTLLGQPRCRGGGEQLVEASQERWEPGGAFGSRRCSVRAAPRAPAMKEAVIHSGVTAASSARSSPATAATGAPLQLWGQPCRAGGPGRGGHSPRRARCHGGTLPVRCPRSPALCSGAVGLGSAGRTNK